MTRPGEISNPVLESFSAFVEGRAGLDFPPARWADLARGIRATAAELGFADAEECARTLMSPGAHEAHIALLLARLTVGETYFFREEKVFEVLEKVALPELIRARRATGKRLKIWSAGCCTGEEPHSIAIVIERALPDLADWDVTILGTDINAEFLRKAGEGIYGEWSFRGVSDAIKARYFLPREAGRLEVVPRIRKLVRFECLNLVEDVPASLLDSAGAVDVIFCRNVLMYFSEEQVKNVAARLHGTLAEDGWLFPGSSEISRQWLGQFTSAHVEGAMVCRKSAPATPAAVPVEMPRLAPPVPAARPAPEIARQPVGEGQLADAIAACDRVIAEDKLAPSHHYLRGILLEEQGAPREAAAALRRALYLDPSFVLAHFALGNLLRREGRAEEAARCFENTRALLRRRAPDAVLSDADGLTASRLLALLDSFP